MGEEPVPGRRKVRVDQLLVDRGLAATRSEAGRLILAGRVRLGGAPADKAGRLARVDAALDLVSASPFVGRGGEKLAAALDALGVSPADRVCLDVGASTGGFTDCLLQRGARRVYAVDVGRGVLDARLRADARVTVLEGVNARHLDPTRLEERASLATIDVSFISLGKVLPAVVGCLDLAGKADASAMEIAAVTEIVALVKPQFEVGRGKVGKGGVVRDGRLHREVVMRVAAFGATLGLSPRGVVASSLRGPKGNREFFLHFGRGSDGLSVSCLERAVERAVGAAPRVCGSRLS